MKAQYTVKFNGKWYKAGEEIPERKTSGSSDYGLQPVECIGVSPNGEMEMCETINHLLCGWWAGAYSTITFPRYNRGVQATTTERKGD